MMDDDRGKQFQMWARQIKIRDQWECQICSARGVYLEAHHLNGWNAFPEERFLLLNGVTLCRNCHDRFHNTFGYGGNTEFQYKQYEEIAVLLRKVAKKKIEEEG